ncbi:MAG: hypothetical protein MK171_04705 [Pirellulales bacterium]|nr:hypothetical protein [Pirellulales bacterium]
MLVPVDSGGLGEIPWVVKKCLAEMITIVLDRTGAEIGIVLNVRIIKAVYGVDRTGTAYWMDEVPILQPAVMPSALSGDEEMLREIGTQLERGN